MGGGSLGKCTCMGASDGDFKGAKCVCRGQTKSNCSPSG